MSTDMLAADGGGLRPESTDDRSPSALWIPLALALAVLLSWGAASILSGNGRGSETRFEIMAPSDFPSLFDPSKLSADFDRTLSTASVDVPGSAAEMKREQPRRGGIGDARRRGNGSTRTSSAARQTQFGTGSFEALDRNDDGRLSPAEFAILRVETVRPSWQGNKADDIPPYVSTQALNSSIEDFRRADRDNDWFLSAGEFRLLGGSR